MINPNTTIKLTLELTDNSRNRTYTVEYSGDSKIDIQKYNIDFESVVLDTVYRELIRKYIQKDNERLGSNANGRNTGGIYTKKRKKRIFFPC